MRYFVTVAGRSCEVVVDGAAVTIDGVAVTAELRDAGDGLRHLILDGVSLPLLAEPGNARGTWRLQTQGRWHEAEALDERTHAIRQLTAASAVAQGPKPVRAPMPGLVVRLEVEVGQPVAAGQGVAIVEAMKMENELKAEVAGVVSRILVAPGQAVEKGTVLVEFEAAA